MEFILKRVIRRTKKIPKDIKAYRMRDSIILNDLDRKANKNQMNLHWCSEKRKDGIENIGDYLGVPIYDYMTKYYNLDKSAKFESTKHLYTVGSIIFFGKQDAIIWGSGLLSNPLTLRKLSKRISLDIRAVRGPETRRELIKQGYDCPEIYGDPGILMPLIYKPNIKEKKSDYSVILHKSDKRRVKNQIDILSDDYKVLIDQIASSKKIISSSLHGIILAEAYGVEAILLEDTRRDFSYFKYNDYYYSTGRMEYPVAKTIEKAIEMKAPKLPDLSELQQNIINAFPKDIWEHQK